MNKDNRTFSKVRIIHEQYNKALRIHNVFKWLSIPLLVIHSIILVIFIAVLANKTPVEKLSGIGIIYSISFVLLSISLFGCYYFKEKIYNLHIEGLINRTHVPINNGMTVERFNELELLRLSKYERKIYQVARFVISIPRKILKLLKKVWSYIKKGACKIKDEFVDIGRTFKNGDWKTKVSYFVLGFGNLARGQIGRGILFLAFELIFIFYMVLWGGYWIGQIGTLGTVGPGEIYNEIYDQYVPVYNDNSFKILLYSVLSIFFIIAFIVTWRMNIKQNQIAEKIIASGKKLKSGKDDIKSLVDDQFHKTLLALPVVGILVFTVMPIVFMILIAFTNYDAAHNGYTNNLFTWVGLDNFNTILNWNGAGNKSYSAAFGEILAWTIMWSFFATFSNYFLGMIVAMLINKKGIKFKKLWRTILVLTIAIPQFISLLYVSKMFADNGIVNGFLNEHFGFTHKFFGTATSARITVILINIWIGIPYLMLIATGILMNIPEDLYESAKIDGANVWQQYTKITLPYMLFITGPYLLTSFIGNMNNFNVIYLLTGGGPTNSAASGAAGTVGYTDLLVTWLFKITMGAEAYYYMAAVIGVLIFIVIATISVIIYNILPSNKNEEDYQ